MTKPDKSTANFLIFVYDNGCKQCTRTAETLKKWDKLNRLSPVPLRNIVEFNELSGLNVEMAQKELAVFYKEKWSYGFNSIVLISKQLPLMWISIPFLYLLKWTKIGGFLYRKTAMKRFISPEYCTINP